MAAPVIWESDDDETVDIKKIEERTILIIGLSGSGKSSIINSMQGENYDHDISQGFTAGTVQTTVYPPVQYEAHKSFGNNENNTFVSKGDLFSVKFCDTVGIGDPKNNGNQIIDSLEKTILSRIKIINRVYVVIKKDRLRAKFSGDLKLIIGKLEEWGAKPVHFTILCTFTEFLKKDVVQKFMNDVVQNDDMKFLKPYIKRILPVSMPLLCDIQEDYVDSYKKFISKSKIALKKDIFFASESFNAAEFVINDYDIQLHKLNNHFNDITSDLKAIDKEIVNSNAEISKEEENRKFIEQFYYSETYKKIHGKHKKLLLKKQNLIEERESIIQQIERYNKKKEDAKNVIGIKEVTSTHVKTNPTMQNKN